MAFKDFNIFTYLKGYFRKIIDIHIITYSVLALSKTDRPWLGAGKVQIFLMLKNTFFKDISSFWLISFGLKFNNLYSTSKINFTELPRVTLFSLVQDSYQRWFGANFISKQQRWNYLKSKVYNPYVTPKTWSIHVYIFFILEIIVKSMN